jgi:hypothetical protein
MNRERAPITFNQYPCYENIFTAFCLNRAPSFITRENLSAYLGIEIFIRSTQSGRTEQQTAAAVYKKKNYEASK